MTRDEILDRVRRTIAEMFEIDVARLHESARLVEDLDLDSIDAVDMAVRLQELTGRRVDEADLRAVRTIGDVTALVLRLRAGT